MPNSGVYPVHTNTFKINTSGSGGTPTSMKPIADLETFSVSFDNGIEEWTPMDTEGWVRRLMTAKSVTISLSGKRNVGDAGNDYVAGLSLKNGREAESTLEWTMIDGTVVSIPSVISVTNNGGGDSTNVAGLEFEVQSNGKPTVTPPVKTPV